MTDTGQVPGEGLPENAGMVEQPGVLAPDAYTYLSDSPAQDEDLLLPGAQGAWGNEIAPPAPEPVVETVHAPGPHETAGRDSGSVDLGGVRLPEPPQPAPRRPLHLGPPIPDVSASPVRSLADRGPADLPARQSGPPTLGPEYLDVPRAREAAAPQAAAPWGAQATAGTVGAEAAAPEPEPTDAAQAVVTRVAAEAGAVQEAEGASVAPAAQDTGGAGAVVTGAGDQGTAPLPAADHGLPGAPAAEPAWEAGAPGVTGPPAEATPPEHLREPETAPVAEMPVAEMPVAEAPVTEPVAPQDGHLPVADPAGTAAVPDQARAAEAPQTAAPGDAPGADASHGAQVPGAVATAPQPGGTPQEVQAPDGAAAADPAPRETGTPPAAVPQHPQEAGESPAAEAPDAGVAAPQVAEAADAAVVVPGAADAAPEHAGNPEVPVPGADTLPGTPAAAPEAPVAEAAASAPGPADDAALTETPHTAGEPADAVPVVGTGAPAPAEPGAAPAQGPQQSPAVPLPGTVHPQPGPDRPLGEFVPVEGTVPTTPHLAPTPPQGVTVPAAEPHEEGPEPAQDPDDLDTRGAGVEAEPARSAGPAAPAYDDAEREAVLKVMRERRDIRNGFRGDPIPHEVLLRVLEAAHTAPSVGHSQPWDFVVIRSAETRRSMHELAMRQRDAYAKSLPKGRAKQFKELKIEAILDTPVNIVVTADPTRGGRHTLGRHTQPQMAPYSSALAVENLWLAARAEGLGVGWVSFFDEREMVRALGLPEHLEVVAYLCVGYVDEFPDEPELMQAGWSKRRPLSWVVHEETYGRRALPGEDPHDLLAETVAQIRPLDAKALGEAWERQKRMTKPAGALGMLEIISAQLSGLSRQCPPPVPEPAAVAIFAGDHGVHAQGVTPWPQEVTAQMVANFLGGGAVCNAFAAQVGAEVCVVDVGVTADLPATPGLLPRKIRAGTSDMTTGPAMTREEAKKAIEVGIETARDLVAAGNKALLTGEMGIANTTASAALISVFTGADPAEVTGRGTGINDETLARKTEVVRRALELHQPDPADPLGVLAAVGGFEHAAMVGLLLGGASLRTPVILDGVSAGAAALVARAVAPEVLAACIAGHRSAEPGHVAALNTLGLRPLVDLDLRLGEGTGALLALPLVQSTARAMHEVATFDSAGVTEK
ncbi:nicotinate-nucleotide--dimethylbenzimidazole phosphoribosyltransferase [Streptomyces sp. NPDC126497]|uniref:nicotinate-nucleotide--dimethylbenzimidazole phosphoribosyltransferase n=1 Tax=Streptomyces sp. NPDC126497 TaxID=3155313 RepID=UPI003333639E